MRRPGARDPIGILVGIAAAGTSRERVHHIHLQPLGQQYGLMLRFQTLPGDLLVGMDGVAVTAQRADNQTMIRYELLEPVQFFVIVQQDIRFAVGCTRVISSTEFNGVQPGVLDILQSLFQWLIAEQSSKYA